MFKAVNKGKGKYNNLEKNKTDPFIKKKEQKKEEIVIKGILYIRLKKYYKLLKSRLQVKTTTFLINIFLKTLYLDT